MNIRISKFPIVAIISLLFFVMTAGICNAQEFSRKGKTELFGTIQMLGSEEIKYTFSDMQPVRLDIDNAAIYGIGYGYNMTDHWNFNTDLLFGSADTDVKIVKTTAETEDMDYILFDINLDYNVWKSRFTPVVSGGVGIMDFSIDTSATGVGDVDERSLSYNLGAGIRWDIEDNMFLKMMYRSTWTDFDDADDNMRYDGFSLNIAYMY
jgi:opacity protein-like surface antigen